MDQDSETDAPDKLDLLELRPIQESLDNIDDRLESVEAGVRETQNEVTYLRTWLEKGGPQDEAVTRLQEKSNVMGTLMNWVLIVVASITGGLAGAIATGLIG